MAPQLPVPVWDRGVRTNGDGHRVTVPLLLAPEISGTGTRCLSRVGTAAPANSWTCKFLRPRLPQKRGQSPSDSPPFCWRRKYQGLAPQVPVPVWDLGACKFLNLQILKSAASVKTGTVTNGVKLSIQPRFFFL